MKALQLALGLVLITIPAVAKTIAPNEAQSHIGQLVTVEGVVGEVHVDGRPGVTFLNVGGHFPNQAFTGVVFKDDADKFPNMESLAGKVVDIIGKVQVYKGRVENILNDPGQLKSK